MARPEGPPIRIKETLLEGVTFAQALARWAEQKNVDISNIPTGPTDPELFFSKVDIRSVSKDGQHAVGVGFEGNDLSVIRDGQIVLRGEFARIPDVTHSADFSRLLVTVSDRDGRQSAYYIGRTTNHFLGMSKRKITTIPKSDAIQQLVLAKVTDKGTRLEVFTLGEDTVESCIGVQVKGEFCVASVVTYEMPIVWMGHKYNRWGNTRWDRDYVFSNSQLLAEGGRVHFLVNEDSSRVFTIAGDDEKISVALNGSSLFKGKYSLGGYQATPDLNLAVVELKDRQHTISKLLIVTPEGRQVTEPFEDLRSLERQKDGFRAEIKRKGVRREILITRDGETEETQPAVATDTP